MQWDDSHAAGFTTGTPWLAPPENYRRINAKAQMRDETSIRAFYKKLVALRKALPVISEGEIEFILRDDPQILAYRRYTDHSQMLVLCNLIGENAEVTLPKGWKNAKVLLANWSRDTICEELTLNPYECLALLKENAVP